MRQRQARDDTGRAHRRRPADHLRAAGQERDAGTGSVRADAPRAARRGHRARDAVRYRRSDRPEVAGRGRRRAAAATPRWCCSNAPRMRRPPTAWPRRSATPLHRARLRRRAGSRRTTACCRWCASRAPAPSWLIDQLARIDRVDSVDAGFKLSHSDEWITPDAYHRERRGGRSLFVEASRYRFGQAGRTQRLEALQKSLPALEAQEDTADAGDQQAGRPKSAR